MPLPPVPGKVPNSLEHVSFSYNPGEAVIHETPDPHGTEPGQSHCPRRAFSGAGKSTIASLLPRFYDVDSERPSASTDQDIRDSDRWLPCASRSASCPRRRNLFNGTVYDNIQYGRLDATKEEVEAAAKAANAHEFILQLPQGYHTHAGRPRGSTCPAASGSALPSPGPS
jgi:ATP-binding cassette, subfamily B, bacterial MsbA